MDYDLCTWNTVMPGSIHETGTVYELEFLEDGEWVIWDGEAFSIEMLPTVDPEKYRSLENHRLKQQAQNIRQLNPTTATTMTTTKTPVWVVATGSPATRVKMAKNYLRYYAWASISGMNGHDALLVVVINLRLYHCLERSTAISLVNEHFNPRCKDLQGNPCPWSGAEILHKWNEAGKSDAYPTLGVKDPKARAKVAAMMVQSEVAEFLSLYTSPGGTCDPMVLREAFISFRGGEDVNAIAFGRAVSKAPGIERTKSHGVRGYKGFHLRVADLGFTKGAVNAA
jgi:hypothetical protein